MPRDTAAAKLADGSAAQRARTTTANRLGPVVVATKVCRKPRARPGTGTRRTTRNDSQCARSATTAAAARIATPDNQLGIQGIISSARYHSVLGLLSHRSCHPCDLLLRHGNQCPAAAYAAVQHTGWKTGTGQSDRNLG